MIRSRAIPPSSVCRLEGVNLTVTCATLKCPSHTRDRLLTVLRDIIFARLNSEFTCMHCHYVVAGAQIPPQGSTQELIEGCFLLDPLAAEFRRRRQPEACRAAAAGKNSARRRASRNLWTPPPPYFSRRAAALVKKSSRC